MSYLKSFFAGFFSTIIFHQGLLALLHFVNISPRAAYSMSPTEPFGLPSFVSGALFGGLWGILIWKFISGIPRKSQIIRSVVFGAIGPTLVAFTIVMPLKGIEFKLGYIPFGLLLNGFWGLGLWVLMQVRIK